MIFKHLREDIDSVLARDPAARSRLEVILCYPGFHALLAYRVAHRAWNAGWPVLGRLISNVARTLTGIEIHPAARIGRRFFIDHGMGVVIGETAEIGDDVTLYQGVTLGGTSLDQGKRHPTLGNGVIVGSGAQVLGPFLVGDGARIGANAVVVKPVPAGATAVGIPARIVEEHRAAEFCAYGVSAELPDPVARALTGLVEEMEHLRARIAELEAEKANQGGRAKSRTLPAA